MGRPLNPDELEQVKSLIRQNFVVLAIQLYGSDSVPKELLDDAVKAGKLTQALLDSLGPRGVAGDAYLLGYEQHTHPAQTAHVRPEEFAARVDSVHEKLSDWERRMAKQARMKGAQFVVGLGNEVADNFATTVISSDNEQARNARRVIAEETATSIEARESWLRLRGTLGEKLGEDWARDLHRIAATEIQAAVNAGIADAIEEQEGHEALVAVVPHPDACDVCMGFYVGAGKPRVFKLGELPPHGVNFRKPKAQWVPCLPPSHPWCFPAGTPVLTSRGGIPIEQVRLGDAVLTHRGRWRSVSELRAREYTGDLVDVVTGLGGFSSTPNHEALLVGGRWRCAGHLEPGLDLVHAPREVASFQANDAPPTRHQERSLDPVLFAFLGGVVPVAAVHFHGEHLLVVGEVDQVATDLVVRLRGDSGLVECGEEDRLQLGQKLSGRLCRPELDGRFVVFRSARGSVGGHGHRLAVRLGEALVALDLGIAESALLDSGLVQNPHHGATRSPDGAGDGQHGFAIVVSAENLGIQGSVGDSVHAGNVVMTRASVNTVARRSFSGLVYNIGVVEDHSYVAGGVAVHNCHCQLIYIPDGWAFDEDWVLRPHANASTIRQQHEGM